MSTRLLRSPLGASAAALMLALPLAMALPAEAQQRPDYRTGGIPVPQIEQEEMAATDVLNALSARGYSQYRRVERIGDVYQVDAMTRDFRTVTLEVDPRGGAIRELTK